MTTQEQISIKDLQGVDIFAGLSDHDLEQIAKACSQRTYQPGEHCAIEKDTTDELRIVNEGKVAIEMRVQYVPYAQMLGIGTCNKGQCVGLVCSCGATCPYCSGKMYRENSNHLYKGFRFAPHLQRKAIS